MSASSLISQSSRTNHRRAGRSTSISSGVCTRRQHRLLACEKLEDRRMLSVGASGENALELFSTSTALFVENNGQWADEQIRYGFSGDGVNIAFQDDGLAFHLIQQEVIETAPGTLESYETLSDRLANADDAVTHSTQFRVRFDGANDVTPVGLDQAETRFNYLVGDTGTHRSNVAGYTTVAYEDLYDGIDLHTFGRRSSLKYEFYVAPGADYEQISVSYQHIDGLWIDDDGSLHVQTELGELVDDAPYIYQLHGGQEVEVAGRFILIDNDTYAFEITGEYDPNVELIIDPDLAWSSYVGGDLSSNRRNGGKGVAVDGNGDVLISGSTVSPNWASGGWDTSLGGPMDAYVVKLSSSGEHLWSSYLGGSGEDVGVGIAVDGSGNVLVTGFTWSSGWVSGGWDTTFGGGQRDAFVVKLSTSGQHLWSSYLGGDGDFDTGEQVAVDANGEVLLTGRTQSVGWISGGWDPTSNGGGADGYVVKLSGSGEHLWSSYLGGSEYEEGIGITADGDRNVIVTGYTTSSGWLSGGWDTNFDGDRDAFVVKLSSSGAHLWSTYLGGANGTGTFREEEGNGIAVDASGNVFVSGVTRTSGWISGGWDTSYNGGTYDGFVVKLSGSGAHLWSTYLGGDSSDESPGIAVDASGNVLVTGWTRSSDWIFSGGWDTTWDGDDGYVLSLSSSGEHLWSSYIGGGFGWDITADRNGNAVVTGSTSSSGWVSGGWDTTFNGDRDGFVAKITLADSLPGDFDSNGEVDGHDLLTWQRGESPDPRGSSDLADWMANFGPVPEPLPPPTADFNQDGAVDDQDLATWETSFGLIDPFGRPAHEFGDADEDGDIDGEDFIAWQREIGNYQSGLMTSALFSQQLALNTSSQGATTSPVIILTSSKDQPITEAEVLDAAITREFCAKIADKCEAVVARQRQLADETTISMLQPGGLAPSARLATSRPARAVYSATLDKALTDQLLHDVVDRAIERVFR